MAWLSPQHFLAGYSSHDPERQNQFAFTVALILLGMQQLSGTRWLFHIPNPLSNQAKAIKNICHTRYCGDGLKITINVAKPKYKNKLGLEWEEARQHGPVPASTEKNEDRLLFLDLNTWHKNPLSLSAPEPCPFTAIWAQNALDQTHTQYLVQQLYPEQKRIILPHENGL